ncbi:MAG: MBL fold metallo-hydrolase, partial [Clostridiaceae bacterium]
MKHQKFLTFSRVLPRVLIIVLCLAMLTACSSVSGSQESGALLDQDNASLCATPETVETIPPDRVLDVTAKLMESLPTTDSFAVLFVNVGKADAAILRFGDTTVLIDTGSAESAPQLIGGLNALGVTSINAVFVTHSHSDHLGGLDALSANYDIPKVYSPFFSEADKNDIGKIVKRAEKLSLPHAALKAGDTVPVADGVTFRVLGPLALNETD